MTNSVNRKHTRTHSMVTENEEGIPDLNKGIRNGFSEQMMFNQTFRSEDLGIIILRLGSVFPDTKSRTNVQERPHDSSSQIGRAHV